jgi:hypothetical protein
MQETFLDTTILYEMSGFFPPAIITTLMQYCEQKDQYQAILQILQEPRAISSRAFIRQLMDYIFQVYGNSELCKPLLILLADYDFRLTLESDPQIQYSSLFAELTLLLTKAK